MAASAHIPSATNCCCDKLLAAVFAGTLSAAAFCRLLAVKFCTAVGAAEQGVRPFGFKFLPAALAGQRNRDADSAFTGFQLLIALPAADAFLLQKLLPLDLFLGQLRCGKLKLPDKPKVDFHLLHPVAVDTLRGMDNDFLNKLIDHGRGQLGKIGVLPCLSLIHI